MVFYCTIQKDTKDTKRYKKKNEQKDTTKDTKDTKRYYKKILKQNIKNKIYINIKYI